MAYKILTVDDSKTIRMIVKKAFSSYNCEMFEGENGVEGLAIANKEKPDLIILDITMPVMTGIEMLEKLKAERDLKNIPVIMLTAESGKENVMKIVKMGVRDYMVKPFNRGSAHRTRQDDSEIGPQACLTHPCFGGAGAGFIPARAFRPFSLAALTETRQLMCLPRFDFRHITGA